MMRTRLILIARLYLSTQQPLCAHCSQATSATDFRISEAWSLQVSVLTTAVVACFIQHTLAKNQPSIPIDLYNLLHRRLYSLQPYSPLRPASLHDLCSLGIQLALLVLRGVHIRIDATRGTSHKLGVCKRDGQPGSNIWRVSISGRGGTEVFDGIWRHFGDVWARGLRISVVTCFDE